MSDKKYNLEWSAERSIRYHDRRRAFYETFETVASTLSLIAGSVAVASVLKNVPVVAIIFSSIAAVTGFFQIVIRPAEMAGKHAHLKQLFTDLRLELDCLNDSDNSEKLKEFERKRLTIEREEPTIFRMVDLMCHNELALAKGIKNSEVGSENLYYMNWWQKLTANIWHWETSSVPSTADKYQSVEAKKLKK